MSPILHTASALLWPRDISQDVDNVKHTFSSWDTCMDKNYCKYVGVVRCHFISDIARACLAMLTLKPSQVARHRRDYCRLLDSHLHCRLHC